MPAIDTIELYHVSMPLIYPWRTAYGSDDVIESVLIKMWAGDAYGWGETTPLAKPTYSPEYTGGVYHVCREILAPALIGKEIDSGETLQQQFSWVAGNFFAKGGLDAAWWDLQARRQSQPLWKLIGGTNQVIDVGADFGVQDSIDMLLSNITGALDAGFKRIKLKYCPGWDVDMIAAVRSTFPDPVFHIDCNSGYTLDDLPMFKKLDQYNLAMIEQPLMRDDLVDHAELQRQIETPICLDESITSPEKAWRVESALGASVCKALATLPNMKYPSDVFPSTRFYTEDLSTPPIELSGPSQMTLSDTPGAGAEPIPERLERQAIDRAVIR